MHNSNLKQLIQKHTNELFWVLLIVCIAVSRLEIQPTPIMGDEGSYVRQIANFMAGNFTLDTYIAVPPTYAFGMAFLGRLFGANTLEDLRILSFLIASLNIYVFYWLVSMIDFERRHIKTLQLSFFPVLFPFFFLVYTDAWALLFMLLSLGAAMQRKPIWSCLAGALSIALRPPQILWIVFGGIIGFISLYTHLHSLSQQKWKWLGFPLILFFFGIFVLVNHGVSMGDRENQTLAIHFNNLFFFFILFFILFLPDCLPNSFQIISLKSRRFFWFLIVIIAFIAVFWSTYHISHPYNTPNRWSFLRNRLLYWTTDLQYGKTIAALCSLLGFYGIISTPLISMKYKIWIPFSIASVLIMPLIEPRYYIAPFSLWILFRKAGPPRQEIAITAFYFAGCFFLLFGILTDSKQRFLP